MRRIALLAVLLVSLAQEASFGGLILFNFTSGTGAPVANTVTGVAFGNMTAVNAIGGGQPSGGAINGTSASDYAGASGTNNIGNAVGSGLFNIGTSAYFAVNVTNTTGNVLVLNDFDFGARSTGTGATTIALRSSADSFASDLVSVANVTNSAWTFKNQSFAPILLGNNATLDFRIYTTGGTGASSAINTRLDDITFDVSTITAVPEPSSITLIVLIGSIGLATSRRGRFATMAMSCIDLLISKPEDSVRA